MKAVARHRSCAVGLALAVVAAAMVGCGGGGGGGGGGDAAQSSAFVSRVPASANGTIPATPEMAQALILSAEQGAVAWINMRGSSPREYSASVHERPQATENISSEACLSGSASGEYSDEFRRRMQNSGGTDWRAGDLISLSFSRCRLATTSFPGGAALVAGSTVDGRADYQVVAWTGPVDNTVAITYLNYSTSFPGGRTIHFSSARMTIAQRGGSPSTAFDTGSEAFFQSGYGTTVTATGDVIYVPIGLRRSAVPGSGGYLDASYAAWRYDTAQHRAVAGSVIFSGAGAGARPEAQVEAPAVSTAPYRVTIGARRFECMDHDHCTEVL